MRIINFTKTLLAAISLLILLAGGVYATSIPVKFKKTVLPKDSLGLLVYINKSGQKKPVKNKAEWQIKRQQVLDRMQQVMGKLPSLKKQPDLNVHLIDSIKEERLTRYTISFTVAENEILYADLYIPIQSGTPKRLPAMLALHGTSALGKKSIGGGSPMANRAYAKELAERGYVVIAPDYPGFGDLKDYDFEKDRYVSGTMKAIFNDRRCVDLLQARKDVDPERIGVIGHSLGGHGAIFAGAFDPRLKVIVSSCGWTLFDHYNVGNEAAKKQGKTLGPWAQALYMPFIKEKYHLDAAQMPFDFDEVIASLAPRAFFSNSPLRDANFDVAGVRKGMDNIAEVYRFLNVEANLAARYPDAEHDFPPKVRLAAYAFIDKILQHTSDYTKLSF
jgi:dienelactone hydrolase